MALGVKLVQPPPPPLSPSIEIEKYTYKKCVELKNTPIKKMQATNFFRHG
jgi:hypothetical protein